MLNKEREQKRIARNKRELERYIEFKYECDRKERELVQLADKINDLTGAQAITYSDMPKGGKPVLFTDYINDLIDKEKILRNSFERAERRRVKIETAIDNLGDGEQKIILKMHYLEDYSFEYIGSILHCHKTTAWSKCKEALLLMKL